MDELLSEKEQIEQIRGWWQENGTYIVAGVVLGIGGIVGFNLWKSGQLNVRVDASNRFEALAEEVAENRLEAAEAIADEIYSDHAGTIYVDQARLAMARLYMDQGRDQDAAGELEALIAGGGSAEMTMVARLRLAKILLYQGKPEDVLSLLSGYEASGFASRFSEALGDAHFALGNFAEADAAYRSALADPRASQLMDTALLQMKISDIPEPPADAASTAPDVGEDPPADAQAEATGGESDGAEEAVEPPGDGGDPETSAEEVDAEPVQ